MAATADDEAVSAPAEAVGSASGLLDGDGCALGDVASVGDGSNVALDEGGDVALGPALAAGAALVEARVGCEVPPQAASSAKQTSVAIVRGTCEL